MMGFNGDSFDGILLKFGPMYSGHTPFDESGRIVKFNTSKVEREKSNLRTALC
jgi:hypothetical protein